MRPPVETILFSILAVLETWLVWAGFLCGFAEFMAAKHFLESFKGSDFLVYSLPHADCEEQKQISIIEPIWSGFELQVK